MVHLSLVAVALAATAFAVPVAEPAALLEARQTCKGQSCVIADLARSTGRPPPTSAPKGGSTQGTQCITRLLRQLQSEGRIPADDPLTLPAKRDPQGLFGGLLGGGTTAAPGGCKPYTLVWARGTGETGAMGNTVGPAIQNGLGGTSSVQWKFVGVSTADGYPAEMLGNDCIGLPGGVAMVKVLEREAAACPQTKFVVGGFSQGAMAVHNGIAFSKPEIVSRIVAAVAVGDPMNGAPIRGFDMNKLKTYCAAGDGVCNGALDITAAHLAYNIGANSDTSKAVQWIKQMIAG